MNIPRQNDERVQILFVLKNIIFYWEEHVQLHVCSLSGLTFLKSLWKW